MPNSTTKSDIQVLTLSTLIKIGGPKLSLNSLDRYFVTRVSTRGTAIKTQILCHSSDFPQKWRNSQIYLNLNRYHFFLHLVQLLIRRQPTPRRFIYEAHVQ